MRNERGKVEEVKGEIPHGAITIRRASGQRRVGISGFSKYDSRFETARTPPRHEVTPRMCATRRTTVWISSVLSSRHPFLRTRLASRVLSTWRWFILISHCPRGDSCVRFLGKEKKWRRNRCILCVPSRRLEMKLLADFVSSTYNLISLFRKTRLWHLYH